MSAPTDLELLDERDQILHLAALAEHGDVLAWLAQSSRGQVERMLTRIEHLSCLYTGSAPDVQATIESDTRAIQIEMLDQTNTVIELAGILQGVIAMLSTLRRQRDDLHAQLQATPSQDQLYDALVARLAEANGCAPADAARIAYILFSDDQDVMANDVVEGLEPLMAFRTAVQRALLALDERTDT